jgi:hypothetical protein
MLPPARVRKGTTRRLHPGGQDEEEEEVEGRREPGSDALLLFHLERTYGSTRNWDI